MTVLSIDRFNQITEKFQSIDPIFVIGDVGIDKYTYGDVRRISPEAPVPVLEVTKEWLKLGLAANISHNLDTLHVKSSLCGIIGDDLNGRVFNDLMHESNLEIDCLVPVLGRPTTFKERIVTNTQQICRVDYESKDGISADVVKRLLGKAEEKVSGHGALIIEDYAKGTFNFELVQGISKIFKEQGKLVATDPSRSTPAHFYKGVTLLKPNRIEAEMMVEQLGYREKSVEKMAEILIDKLDLTMLVITLGGDGMALIDTRTSQSIKRIPTLATEVFDVSGAGDTAISAITSSLVAGASLEEACWIGNCASGVVVGKTGTATVSLQELSHFHKRIIECL